MIDKTKYTKSFSLREMPLDIIEQLRAIKDIEKIKFSDLIPEVMRLGLKCRKNISNGKSKV